MTDAPFTFEGCDSPDACRDGIRPLLGKGMTWSEVHCGRCGRQGVVVHADLDHAPAETAPARVSEPAPEPAPVEVVAEPEAPAANAAEDDGRRKKS